MRTPAFVVPTREEWANTHNEVNLLFDGRGIHDGHGKPTAGGNTPSGGRTIGGADEPLPGSVVTLQVLASGHHLLNAGVLVVRLAHERPHVDDPLALLAGDLRPVTGVGRVRQIFVLLELLADGREQVVGTDALLAPTDETLEGQLLGAAHDGLDHGSRGEVLEVED